MEQTQFRVFHLGVHQLRVQGWIKSFLSLLSEMGPWIDSGRGAEKLGNVLTLAQFIWTYSMSTQQLYSGGEQNNWTKVA